MDEKLEQTITELEARQSRIVAHMEETQEVIDRLKEHLDRSKRQQIKEGQLAPLATALAYHHQVVMGWARLAATADLEDFKELYTEFQKMYRVVTHYEYVAQELLGINPSPFADLEDRDEKLYRRVTTIGEDGADWFHYKEV